MTQNKNTYHHILDFREFLLLDLYSPFLRELSATLMNTNVLRLSLNHPHAFYENEIIAFKKNVANQVSVQSIKAAYTLKQIKLPFRMV